MPTIESAKKRLRQARKRRKRNQSVQSEIRTRTRRFMSLESADEAEEMLDELYSLLDRAVGKNVIHENKAARKKSQLARHLSEISG